MNNNPKTAKQFSATPGKNNRKNFLLPGRNILLERTGGGLRIHAIPRPVAATAYSGSFAATATVEDDTVLFVIAAGYVNIGTVRMLLPGRSGTPVANDATYAALLLTVEVGSIIPAVAFCRHDELPAGSATLAVYVLAECFTDTGGNITRVVQHHYGEVHACGRIV